MKKLLIGLIVDGKAGGVDKYILDFYNIATGNYETISCVSTIDSYYHDGSRYSNGHYVIDCENNNKTVRICFIFC